MFFFWTETDTPLRYAPPRLHKGDGGDAHGQEAAGYILSSGLFWTGKSHVGKLLVKSTMAVWSRACELKGNPRGLMYKPESERVIIKTLFFNGNVFFFPPFSLQGCGKSVEV